MRKTWMKSQLVLASLFACVGSAAMAGQFTTAQEVRPILDATKGNWVALREYDGRDILYFTHLLAWRCGLETVSYAVNGGEMRVYAAEPCYEDEAQPNAIKATDVLPFVTFELQSVTQVDVTVKYDDGVTADMQFQRADILMN